MRSLHSVSVEDKTFGRWKTRIEGRPQRDNRAPNVPSDEEVVDPADCVTKYSHNQ